MRSTSGIPKASVLPEPVGDLTSTSCPSSTSPITSSCTETGSLSARPQGGGDRLGHAEVGESGLLHMMLLAARRRSRTSPRWGEIRLTPTARCAFRSKNPVNGGAAHAGHRSSVTDVSRSVMAYSRSTTLHAPRVGSCPL